MELNNYSRYIIAMFDTGKDSKWHILKKNLILDNIGDNGKYYEAKYLRDIWFAYKVLKHGYIEDAGDLHFMIIKTSTTNENILDDLNRLKNGYPSRNDCPINTCDKYNYFILERILINNFCTNMIEREKDEVKFTMIDREKTDSHLQFSFSNYKDEKIICITLPTFYISQNL